LTRRKKPPKRRRRRRTRRRVTSSRFQEALKDHQVAIKRLLNPYQKKMTTETRSSTSQASRSAVSTFSAAWT